MPNESDELTRLRAENARLIALLESHDIDWRHAPAPTTPSASPPEPSDLSTAEKEGLERIFERPVDLVTQNNLGNPYFRQRVQSERQNLYAR